MLESESDISEGLIKNIHKVLTNGILDIDDAGEYKQKRNCISGASVHTSPPNAVEKHMQELVKWYYENKEKLNPIELATIFKYIFNR